MYFTLFWRSLKVKFITKWLFLHEIAIYFTVDVV